MAMTPLPAAPSRTTPADFSTKADVFVAALPGFVTEANALEVNVNAKEATVVAAEINVNAKEVSAVAAAAVALAAANYKGAWSAQTGAAVVPYAVSHSGSYWLLESNLADVTTKEPGVDPEWLMMPYTTLYEIDALDQYGGASSFTDTTIMAACTAVGSSAATILIRPGTWTQTANRDYSAICPNAEFKFARGAVISHGAYTVNIPNFTGDVSPHFTGTGQITLSGDVKEAFLEWFDTSAGTNYLAALTQFIGCGVKTLTLMPYKTYPITHTSWTAFTSVHGITINGNFATLDIGGTDDYGHGLYFITCDGIHIKDLIIDGNRDGRTLIGDSQASGIFLQGSTNVVIDNVQIKEMGTDSIYIGALPTDHTVRSENIQIRNCDLYRSRRNNISITGGVNVQIIGGSNKSAGATSGASAGTLPKAGIDLEVNSVGTNVQNLNILIEGVEFAGNVSYGFAIGAQASNTTIRGNTFTDEIGICITPITPEVVTNTYIVGNTFVSGTYGLLVNGTGIIDNMSITNNIFLAYVTFGLQFITPSTGNVIISDNMFYGSVGPHAYYNSAHSVSDQAVIIRGNVYSLIGDGKAADTTMLFYYRGLFSDETIIRSGSNRYRVLTLESNMYGNKINIFGANINMYTTAAGDQGDGQSVEYSYGVLKMKITATTAQLNDSTHAINTAAAKVAGYEVFNTTTGRYVYAAGNADDSVWAYAGGQTAHTPIP